MTPRQFSLSVIVVVCITFVLSYWIWAERNIKLWEMTHLTTCTETSFYSGSGSTKTCR